MCLEPMPYPAPLAALYHRPRQRTVVWAKENKYLRGVGGFFAESKFSDVSLAQGVGVPEGISPCRA